MGTGDGYSVEVHPAPTPRVKKTLERAGREATSRGHDHLGTEHLLLALIADPDGIAGRVLHELGVAEAAAEQVRRIVDSPAYRRGLSP
jgi:ATP-dependent Clp protease ATP-binding subunit ClpA